MAPQPQAAPPLSFREFLDSVRSAELPRPGGTRARHDARPAPAQLQPGRKDQHGNDMTCPPGTVPVRRVTLQELMRFETLDQFFRKSPLGTGGHPRLTAAQVAPVHK